jgi:hypothetical protein
LPEIIRLPVECYQDQKQEVKDGEKEQENTEEEKNGKISSRVCTD